jgi:hypothetical protein
MLLQPQQGRGIGSDAFNFVKENKDEILKKAWENKEAIFKNVSNAQRFVEKNIKKNPNPIRYLDSGEIHIPLMSYCGPGTDLNKYRNFPPYNAVDNACRTHDLDFEKAFKLPLGSKERQEAIRAADERAVKELDKYKGMYGQRLARGGLALKQRLEDLDPSIIRSLMGEAYVGVKKEIDDEEKEDKADRKERLRQKGGLDPITGYLMVAGPLTAGALYLESVAAKKLYNLYKQKDSN